MPWRLSWTPGEGAESHDVYFGTANPPQFRTNQEHTMFDASPFLEYKTTYYWRIDEVNGDGKTIGVVWSFTTGMPKGEACFPADTIVWANGRMVEISKVAPGAMVDKPAVSPMLTELHKTVCGRQIENIDVHDKPGFWDRYDVEFYNGNTLAVADSHYFLLESGRWALVQELTVGSKLSTLDGSVTVKTVKKSKFNGTVYNLKIKDSDRYLVGKDGIVVRDW
jgi:hypothetical protein